MELTINRKTLGAELKLLSEIVAKKDTIPALTGVLLKAEGGVVTLTGTDIDVTLRSEIEAEVTEPGTILLSAKRLAEIVKTLRGESLQFAPIPYNDGYIDISCDSASLKVPILRDTFPALPLDSSAPVGTIQSKLLLDMVNRVLVAVPLSPTKHVLNGALLTLSQGAAWINGTDGFRLAYSRIEDASATAEQEEEDLLLSRHSLEALRVICAGSDPVIASVMAGTNHYYFQIGRRLFVALRLAGTFPKAGVKSILASTADPDQIATLDVKRLIQAIHIALLMTKDAEQGIDLDLGDNELRFNAESGSLGAVKESMSITYEGAPLETRVNASYLLAFLETINAETVLMTTRNSSSAVVPRPPLLWSPKTDAFTYRYVLTAMQRNGPIPEPEPQKKSRKKVVDTTVET